jgi:hypothetical protein
MMNKQTKSVTTTKNLQSKNKAQDQMSSWLSSSMHLKN